MARYANRQMHISYATQTDVKPPTFVSLSATLKASIFLTNDTWPIKSEKLSALTVCLWSLFSGKNDNPSHEYASCDLQIQTHADAIYGDPEYTWYEYIRHNAL